MKSLRLALAIASTAFADAVSDWNVILRAAMSTENSQTQARFAAIAHIAMFEAVTAITGDYEPYLRGTVRAPADASQQAAVIAAAHRVLRHYFSSRASALDAERARML